MIASVPMSLISADQRAQPRTSIDTDLVGQYTDDMANGAEFPPIVVFYDGKVHWIADGFHRYYAGIGLGLAEMNCDVREGTFRDAILYSCSANASHGLRRTNADKRRAVMRLLEDQEWSRWSDREIARQCGVSNQFVGNLRPSLSTVDSEPRAYTTKHGTPAIMNTSRIGSSPREPSPMQDSRFEDMQETPSAPSRDAANQEIAEEMRRGAGILTTLMDMGKMVDALPSPRDAASRVPSFHAYAIDLGEVWRISRWLNDFASAWEAKQQKGKSNVAAE
jgi:hypothetical protein